MLNTGIISLWFGSIASIPAGFVLCDGNNGTPDLRDKFVVGAGNTHDPDDTGGTVVHQHSFTSDGHFHNISAGSDIQSGPGLDSKTDIRTVTGNTVNVNHLPPYHSLAFIMKV